MKRSLQLAGVCVAICALPFFAGAQSAGLSEAIRAEIDEAFGIPAPTRRLGEFGGERAANEARGASNKNLHATVNLTSREVVPRSDSDQSPVLSMRRGGGVA